MINDTCEIWFLHGADKSFRKLGRGDPDRMPFIRDVIAFIEENGWILSVHSQLIKVLDQQRRIGEIRDTGSGGYRLFFFWLDRPSARVLFITALEKKSKLKAARVNDFVNAADVLRRRYCEEWEERQG